TYWSSTSLISRGVGMRGTASAASRSSSSARISLHSETHSLQMYTEGPEMNFFTESLDLPQKEQRRCFSLGIGHFESARNTVPPPGEVPQEAERTTGLAGARG